MSFKFKPEDFLGDGEFLDKELWRTAYLNAMAKKANKALQAHLATLPRVVGWPGSASWYDLEHSSPGNATLTALLWGITEIEKKECEHEPYPEGPTNASHAICKHCGVKIKAKWEKV